MQAKYVTIKLILFVMLFSSLCYSQEKVNNPLLITWENTKITDAIRANAYKEYIIENYFESKTDSAYAMALQLLDFTKERQLKKEKADALVLLGNIEQIFGNISNASKNYGLSLNLYEELRDKRGQANANSGIGVSYKKVFNLDEAKKHFEIALELSKSVKDTALISQSLVNIGNIYAWRYKSDKAISYYKESLSLARAIKNKQKEALGLINISNSHIQKKDYPKSKTYIDRAIKIGDSIGNYNILAHAYSVLSQNYYKQNRYDDLIIAANHTLEYAEKISNKEMIDAAYFYLFEAYKGKRDFDLTIKYQDLRKDIRSTLEEINSIRILEKIKIDNRRTKDSLVNINKTLKLGMTHQKEKTNLFLAWGGSLSALSILTFIVFRNSKRKQLKAKQERQKQIDEKEKILNDLEFSIVDAMIEGQEKERQRIAADLHDSVGATLAAAKLQFDYLVKRQDSSEPSDVLIQKTRVLLDDAYNEIRSMAHLKNAGVMAKNGLLPAVEKIVENASGIDGLLFEVQSFGLEQRLDNTLEISIFRIIQELVTNVIKHAKATHAIIHLTNYDNNLNIMVEDNGIGFDPKQQPRTTKGMGINSIDKRVEHLEGQFTIESEIGKGTTIIIDMPL
ncbi:tetratricopeptide repeat-containing sensor histidine kinase [Winogradskyella vidalii]|uniref:tetratricopeptide repeat-containing sensor histidine kinase n=1 Tax=Winogradskyella vidalii TaxID=2615024 RepID=UPI0015CCFC67|nr:tetratricopeptide repeat protein [Winogradskyella vidalii]